MIKKLLAAAALATILMPAAAQEGDAPAAVAQDDAVTTRGKILLVVTNHPTMGDTGKSTGYWLAEVSHAWTRFRDAGYAVTFASPKGGIAPADPRSFTMDDADNKRMWTRPNILALAETKPLSEINSKDYKAIYFAGGHGTMWDFPNSQPLQRVATEIYDNGGVVSAVCHGPAALVNLKTPDGKYLVAGKKVSGFTNAEETSAGLEKVVPFLLEDKLRERGATVETAPNYQPKVVTDGKLVTGQNPASAGGVADAVIKVLEAK